MFRLLTAASVIALSGLCADVVAQDCVAYGVDFQNGGSYFQNISSSDPFTFVTTFDGCEDDECDNILVDPNGNEYECTDTPLEPDNTPELSTCPIDKDQMFSGEWSVILISNNGDTGDPIAYQRSFYLTVGVPVTDTYTPTVTLSSTYTPVVTDTSTTANVISDTVTTTITSPSATISPTFTVHPKPVTVTDIVTVATLSRTSYGVHPTVITRTHTASCVLPLVQQTPDPIATIIPTVVPSVESLASSILSAISTTKSSTTASTKSHRNGREARLAARKALLASRPQFQKRAPDNATVTVTDTNTADFVTTTYISTAAVLTIYATTTTNTTTTLTSTTTTYSGVTFVPVTVTAATKTHTHTIYTVATRTVATRIMTETVVVVSTLVPSAASVACASLGGRMV